MAEDFDYCGLWSIARDALDAVNDLTSAMLSLPRAVPVNPRAIHNPPPDAFEKWEAERKRSRERRAKAVEGIRKAAEKLDKRLAENRFIAPVAGVWPPSAPEIARRLSGGLGMAASAARAVIACKDDTHIDQPKPSAVHAQSTLEAVIAELERRPDVKERKYQRQVEKLRAERPDWPGAETAVKVAPATNRSATATDQGGAGNAGLTTPPAAKPEQVEGDGRRETTTNPDLSERAQLVLKVLFQNKAFDSDHLMRTADIAVKAAGKTADPNQYKEVIVELKQAGYVATKEGRSGGCWLTAPGQLRAGKL